MIVPLLWAAAALAPQAAQIDPTLAAYQKMVKPYQNAAGIHLECSSELLINPIALGLNLDEMDLPTANAHGLIPMGKIDSSLHFAKPNYGSLFDRAKLDIMGQQMEFQLEHIGDGEAIYLLDHLEKTFEGPMALNEVDSPLLEVPLLAAWFGRPGPSLDTLDRLPADPAHEGMTGFRIQDQDLVVQLWFDGKGLLKQASSSTMEGNAVLQITRMSFRQVELLTEVKEFKSFAKAIPEDFSKDSFEDAGEVDSFEDAFIPVGRSAPAASFTDMNGESLTLASLKGKTVLLNFWFYHSGGCREEMPHLQNLWSEVQEQRDDVVFLCVNVGDEKDVIQEWWKKDGFTLKAVQQTGSAVSDAFGVQAYPSNFIIDAEGKVAWRAVGYDEKAIRAQLGMK
jgi:peroxiredoxin